MVYFSGSFHYLSFLQSEIRLSQMRFQCRHEDVDLLFCGLLANWYMTRLQFPQTQNISLPPKRLNMEQPSIIDDHLVPRFIH